MAYYGLEPWGPERMDLGFGIVASTLANIHRDAKKGKAFSPSDFMPRYGEDDKPDTARERVARDIEKTLTGMMKREESRAG